jgi:hypothetical protein
MDWSLDNLTPEERERMKRGLGPHGQFFQIILPRLIEEPPPEPEPYSPIDIPDNPHNPRCNPKNPDNPRWYPKKKGPFGPLG